MKNTQTMSQKEKNQNTLSPTSPETKDPDDVVMDDLIKALEEEDDED